MHLLIDGQGMQTASSRGRGIGRYARNLLTGIRAARPDWKITVVEAGHLPAAAPLPDGVRVLVYHAPLPVNARDRPARWVNERCYADWVLAQRPDAVLTLSPFEWDGVHPMFTGKRPPHFAVLYDLIPLLFSDAYLGDPVCADLYADRLQQLAQADVALAISNCSARDFRRLMPAAPARVSNIGGGADAFFHLLPGEELSGLVGRLAARFRLGREFLLVGGGDDHRKNMAGALQAFACLPERVRDRYDLVIGCKICPNETRRLERLAEELGVGRQLRITGFVTDEELRGLYQMCRVFLFPSLYEGLGLPVVEAMACGAPVVTSASSSLPEYAGPHAWLANPLDPDDIAVATLNALAEPRPLRLAERALFAAQFTWERTAEKACRVIEGCRTAARPPRKRLAWVGPLSAAGTGDEALHLLEALAHRYTIELVTEAGHPRPGPETVCHYPLVPVDQLAARHRAAPYDAFVYHPGRAPFAPHVVGLLRRFGGTVILPDAELQRLLQSGPDAYGDAEATEGILPFVRREAHGARTEGAEPAGPLTLGALEQAQTLVVHASAAWQLLRQRVASPVSHVPTAIGLPEGVLSRAEARRQLEIPAGEFLIYALSGGDIRQWLPWLWRSLAALPEPLRQGARLILADATEPELLRDLLPREGMPPVGVPWPIAGAPEESVLFAAADVCVQFSEPLYRHTPVGLLRAMAAGAACIAADRALAGELPEGVVCRVSAEPQERGELTAVIERLGRQPAARQELGAAARQYIQECHAPAEAAAHLAAVIESTLLRGAVPERRHRQAA